MQMPTGRVLRLWCVALLAAGTLLAAGPEPAAPGDGDTVFRRRIDRLLTLDVPLRPALEIRRILFAGGVGAALMIAGVGGLRSRQVADSTAPPAVDERQFFRAANALVGAVIALGLVSAAANESFGLSNGWLLSVAIGWGWALLLARRLDGRGCEWVSLGAAVVALAGASLMLARRGATTGGDWPIGGGALAIVLAATWAAWFTALVVARLRTRRGDARRPVFTPSLAVFLIASALTLLLFVQSVIAFRAGPRPAMLAAIRDRSWLGYGPDTFPLLAATSLAPGEWGLRPSGWLVAAAGEWQRLALEIGILGVTAFLALPAVAMIRAGRVAMRQTGASRAPLIALSAALLVLVVGGLLCGLLRTPTGHIWFWTLLGLVLATGRGDRAAVLPRRPSTLAGCILWGGVCIGLAVVDLRASNAHARLLTTTAEEIDPGLIQRTASLRLDGDSWLRAHRDAALALTDRARQARDRLARRPADVELKDKLVRSGSAAARAWRRFYSLSPLFPDAAGRLAEALLFAGDRTAVIALLTEHLARHAPDDPLANLLMAQAWDDDPARQFDHLCRAIRRGPIHPDIETVLRAQRPVLDGSPVWRERVDRAWASFQSPESTGAATLDGETLRIEAWRLMSAGRPPEARDRARAAVELYERQVRAGQAPSAVARCDAWQMVARLTYVADVRDFHRAFDAIRRGEQCVAELSGPATTDEASMSDDDRGSGSVWAHDALRAMWGFSALLHLAEGQFAVVQPRIAAALPPARRTPDAVARVWADLALQLHQDFASVAPESRPRHYARFADIVRRYDPAMLATPPATRP